MEEEFMKKLVQSKKICEKTILKLKNSQNEEISSLKQLIKVKFLYGLIKRQIILFYN